MEGRGEVGEGIGGDVSLDDQAPDPLWVWGGEGIGQNPTSKPDFDCRAPVYSFQFGGARCRAKVVQWG